MTAANSLMMPICCSTFVNNSGEELELHMDVAYADLRDRIDRVKPELPEDIERIYPRKFSDDDEEIVFMAVSLDKKYEDALQPVGHAPPKSFESYRRRGERRIVGRGSQSRAGARRSSQRRCAQHQSAFEGHRRGQIRRRRRQKVDSAF